MLTMCFCREATVFLCSVRESEPFLIVAASDVACDTTILERLARDLAPQGPAKVMFFVVRRGERVWQMNDSRRGNHLRWDGTLWLDDRLKALNLEQDVRRVLAGLQASLRAR